MSGFTDIHTHLIYGVDDGAKTEEEMQAMLDAAWADGVTALYATSHVTPGVRPFDKTVYLRHLKKAQQYCWEKGYSITLHSGAEILYTPAIRSHALEHRLPTLGRSRWILMEFVPDISYKEVEEAVSFMESCGYLTILAHIERYPCLRHGGANRLAKKHNVRYQINCDTILKKHGIWMDYQIKKWLNQQLISYVASDSHDCYRRPTRMKEAHEVLCRMVGKRYADRLMGIKARSR